jgi:hypothetical protein
MMIHREVRKLCKYFDWDIDSEQAHNVRELCFEIQDDGWRKGMREAAKLMDAAGEFENADIIRDAPAGS